MKRFLSILLALSMLLCFASCNNGNADETQGDTQKQEEQSTPKKVEGDLNEIYEELNETVDIASYVSYTVSKEEDEDDYLFMMNFEQIYETEVFEKMTDYIFTMPSDYCTTFIVFKFDNGMPSDEDIAALKQTCKESVLEPRASALQMYMPDEYSKMTWAVENESLIWRQYDNALVMIITGDAEAVDAFNAFEAVAVK